MSRADGANRPANLAVRAGRSVRSALLLAFLLAGPRLAAATGPVSPAPDIGLWEPCTHEQAARWTVDGETNGMAALRAAACLATLVERGEDESAGLRDAMRGRTAAETALRHFPASGLAHYLAAYLAGLEAERAPLRGLSLVRVIEREAQQAAALEPALDHGGPDRMLGELYLRAPGFPLSVGDSGKAVLHFRRAVRWGPSAPENRVGLAEALLAEDQSAEACRELGDVLGGPAAADRGAPAREKALAVYRRDCSPGAP
jgi:hypothetical protein